MKRRSNNIANAISSTPGLLERVWVDRRTRLKLQSGSLGSGAMAARDRTAFTL